MTLKFVKNEILSINQNQIIRRDIVTTLSICDNHRPAIPLEQHRSVSETTSERSCPASPLALILEGESSLPACYPKEHLHTFYNGCIIISHIHLKFYMFMFVNNRTALAGERIIVRTQNLLA